MEGLAQRSSLLSPGLVQFSSQQVHCTVYRLVPGPHQKLFSDSLKSFSDSPTAALVNFPGQFSHYFPQNEQDTKYGSQKDNHIQQH
jgi:hypothetical protein